MIVSLMTHTPKPEDVCVKAALGCRSQLAAVNIPIPESKEYIIRKLKRFGHKSIFEHASFTFSVEGISRACSHQLVRHRIASYSQQSQRHVKIDTTSQSWYVVPPSIVENGFRCEKFTNCIKEIACVYDELVRIGVKEEDARFVLPNACKTNIVITMNARELLHFFKLRLAKEAQWEIREMAKKMLRLVKPIAPTIFGDVKEE